MHFVATKGRTVCDSSVVPQQELDLKVAAIAAITESVSPMPAEDDDGVDLRQADLNWRAHRQNNSKSRRVVTITVLAHLEKSWQLWGDIIESKLVVHS